MSSFAVGMNEQLIAILGNPATTHEKYLLLICALLALWVGLGRIPTWLGTPLKGPGGAAGAVIFGALLTLAVLQLASQVVPADIQAREGMYRALVMTALTGGLLAPLTARLYASSFGKALVAWVLSGLLMLGVLSVARAAVKSTDIGVENKRALVEEPDY